MFNLNVKVKQLLAFGTIIVLTLILSIISFLSFKSILKSVHNITDIQIPKQKTISNIEVAQKTMGLSMRGLMNNKIFNNEQLYKTHLDLLKNSMKEWDTNYKLFDSYDNSSELKLYWNEYKAIGDSWRENYNELEKLLLQKKQETSIEKQNEYDEKLFVLFQQIYEKYQLLDKTYININSTFHKETDSTVISSDKIISFSQFMLILLTTIITLIGIILAIILSTQMSKKIKQIKEAVVKAETGDLNVRIVNNSKDELGILSQAFNSFLDRTSATIFGIRHSSDELKASATEMLAISNNIASSSEEMSIGMNDTTNALSSSTSNLTSIATSVEEISSTIKNLASASEETSIGVTQSSNLIISISNSIQNISQSALNVSDSVDNVVSSVKEINVSLNEVTRSCDTSIQITSDANIKAKDTNLIFDKLNDSSKQIGRIISVINDIAEQTNMLALNAAIEAVRAGEVGKGFAVVANEVKELAKQTADATGEIRSQIENMQSNMNEAVGAVQGITEVIKEINGITNNIAAAVTEQSLSISQISSSSISAAGKVKSITSEIQEVSEKSKTVAISIEESERGVREIAFSSAELSKMSEEVSMNTERISANLSEISSNSHDISSAIQESAKIASSSNDSAKYLSDISSKLDSLVTHFKL